MSIASQSGTPRRAMTTTFADRLADGYIASDLNLAANLRDRSATMTDLGRHGWSDAHAATRVRIEARRKFDIAQAYRMERAA